MLSGHILLPIVAHEPTPIQILFVNNFAPCSSRNKGVSFSCCFMCAENSIPVDKANARARFVCFRRVAMT